MIFHKNRNSYENKIMITFDSILIINAKNCFVYFIKRGIFELDIVEFLP